MAKKADHPDRYLFFGVLIVTMVGAVVFAYLMGVRQTLFSLQDVLPI